MLVDLPVAVCYGTLFRGSGFWLLASRRWPLINGFGFWVSVGAGFIPARKSHQPGGDKPRPYIL
jgi:hypothetical protein